MYADYEYYEKEYLLGKEPVIAEGNYLYYEKQARAEVDKITFNRSDIREGYTFQEQNTAESLKI